MKRFTLLVVCLFIVQGFVTAQDRSMLSVERIFNSADFRAERFGPARWLADGSR